MKCSSTPNLTLSSCASSKFHQFNLDSELIKLQNKKKQLQSKLSRENLQKIEKDKLKNKLNLQKQELSQLQTIFKTIQKCIEKKQNLIFKTKKLKQRNEQKVIERDDMINQYIGQLRCYYVSSAEQQLTSQCFQNYKKNKKTFPNYDFKKLELNQVNYCQHVMMELLDCESILNYRISRLFNEKIKLILSPQISNYSDKYQTSVFSQLLAKFCLRNQYPLKREINHWRRSKHYCRKQWAQIYGKQEQNQLEEEQGIQTEYMSVQQQQNYNNKQFKKWKKHCILPLTVEEQLELSRMVINYPQSIFRQQQLISQDKYKQKDDFSESKQELSGNSFYLMSQGQVQNPNLIYFIVDNNLVDDFHQYLIKQIESMFEFNADILQQKKIIFKTMDKLIRFLNYFKSIKKQLRRGFVNKNAVNSVRYKQVLQKLLTIKTQNQKVNRQQQQLKQTLKILNQELNQLKINQNQHLTQIEDVKENIYFIEKQLRNMADYEKLQQKVSQQDIKRVQSAITYFKFKSAQKYKQNQQYSHVYLKIMQQNPSESQQNTIQTSTAPKTLQKFVSSSQQLTKSYLKQNQRIQTSVQNRLELCLLKRKNSFQEKKIQNAVSTNKNIKYKNQQSKLFKKEISQKEYSNTENINYLNIPGKSNQNQLHKSQSMSNMSKINENLTKTFVNVKHPQLKTVQSYANKRQHSRLKICGKSSLKAIKFENKSTIKSPIIPNSPKNLLSLQSTDWKLI